MDGGTAYNARDMSYVTRNSVIWAIYIIRTYVYGTNLRYAETRHMGPYCTIWRKTNVLEKHTAPTLLTYFDFDAIQIYDYDEKNVSI